MLDARDNHYTTETRNSNGNWLGGKTNVTSPIGTSVSKGQVSSRNVMVLPMHMFPFPDRIVDQPLWRNGLARWTSNSRVVGSTPISGVVHLFSPVDLQNKVLL